MTTETLGGDPYVAAFPEIKQFWEATERGVLTLPRCRGCNETHWHPRAQCPFCRGTDLEWIAASGQATLHTYTVVHRPDGNYVLAYAKLQEGPLVMTNIVDAGAAALQVGLPLQVAFRATIEGRMAPVFRLS
jgi:uncharacterized protein